MEQQAASQTKMSRKGDKLSPLQYIAISEKGKSEKLCLSLSEEILQDQKEKISAFITDCSYELAPRRSPLSSAGNSPPWLQQQRTGQADTITSTLELLKRRQLSHGLLHCPSS